MPIEQVGAERQCADGDLNAGNSVAGNQPRPEVYACDGSIGLNLNAIGDGKAEVDRVGIILSIDGPILVSDPITLASRQVSTGRPRGWRVGPSHPELRHSCLDCRWGNGILCGNRQRSRHDQERGDRCQNDGAKQRDERLRLAWHRLVLLAMAVNVRGPGQNVCGGARGRGREVYFMAPGSESERAEKTPSPLAMHPAEILQLPGASVILFLRGAG